MVKSAKRSQAIPLSDRVASHALSRRAKVLFWLLAASSTCSPAVFAQSSTIDLMVTAKLQPSCRIFYTYPSNATVSFGTIQTNERVDDTSAGVLFQCTQDVPYASYIDLGQNANGTQRRMKATVEGSDYYLSYGIYTDAARTIPYPTSVTTLGSGLTGGYGSGIEKIAYLYGRTLPSSIGNLPLAGDYTDVVQFTVEW
ncbi:Csu type fimbrial protein [Sphingomonas fennica]|uniref:Spore coat protein U/FanG domain-containing protein n=1 Tax=Edaphosphingomonas fennica TaxID=114404 RepID=A0A2T4I5L4_9SPHN|nr:spore coat U domain-containing protein [Sphingomonas fennica]PTD25475.1 hypothetical protein CV103_05730 [Sphingomonas fennica]